jgi:hypothetical protein
VTDDGQELLADYHGPRAVVEAMEWAYPSLSVEGGPYKSVTGREHSLVITAVALLGMHWPGVTTLDDFTEFLAEGPKIEKTENAPHEVLAVDRRPRRAARRVARSSTRSGRGCTTRSTAAISTCPTA